jgi:hypothetical protein
LESRFVQTKIKPKPSDTFPMPYNFPSNLQKFLPSKTLSVPAFITFAFPSKGAPCPPKFMRVEKFYSELPPTTEDASQVANLAVPPESIIEALCQLIRNNAVTIKSIVCQHNALAGHQRYPIHLAFYWKEVMHQYKIQERWQKAVTNLYRNLDNNPIYAQANAILPHLAWTRNLTGFINSIDIHQLSAFLTDEWLTDDHELMMLDILKQDLATANCADNVFIENTAFLTLLTVACRNQQEYNSSQAYEWIRTRGRELASGQKRYLATIVNQDNVHWTALLLDFKTGAILFGDSYGKSMPPDLQSVLEWWIQHHTGKQFTYKRLTITRQTDHFSCGMLAWHALHCHLFSKKLQV